MVLEIPPADDGVDQRQHHGCLADGAGGRRAGRRRQGQGRQIPDPAARLQGASARGLHRVALDNLSAAMRCCAPISRAAATPTSPRRSPTPSASSSIPCRRRPSRHRPKFVDAIDVVFDSTIPYDLRFFQSLDRIVQREPWLERDKAMIDLLKSIGIEKGKPFNPDAKTKGHPERSRARGPRLARTAATRASSRRRSTKARQWALPASPDSRRHA